MPTDVAALVGNYANLRSSFTDFTKAGQLISRVQIATSRDGQLMLLGLGDPQYFVEIDNGLFRRVDQYQTIAFRFDKQGQASHIFLNEFPSVSFERVNAFYSPSIQFGLLGFCGLVFLWALIAWPVQYVSPRWNMPKRALSFRKPAWLLALVFILLSVGFLFVLQDPFDVVFGVSPLTKVLLLANLTIPLLTLVLISKVPSLMRESRVGLGSRMFHALVTLAGISYSWFLFTWRMFGY